MSWLFSRALVEAFSEENSSGGEPCAQLNVAPTAHQFWRSDKPMDASRFSRFGLTSQVLTADRGEELLTWFRAGFPARTSVLPAAETVSTASVAASGVKWRGSFAKWNPSSSTWRTPQCSLLEDSTEFSETWPRWGSMRNGECYQRPMLAPRTSAKEPGFLPTPVAVDTGSFFNRSASSGAALRPTLGAMAKYDLWPTPTVKGNYNRKGLSAQSGDGLATAVQKWATPCARDFRHPGRSRMERTGSKAGECLPQQVSGPLNPTWVEWLMGWPIGWTALQPLEMDKFREWQQQHGCSFDRGSVTEFDTQQEK
jgi:hypothetical protein